MGFLYPISNNLRRVSFIFFFSSRSRHTRLVGDWSSDVCSSDLAGPVQDHHEELLGVGLAHRGEKLAHARRVHRARQAPIQLPVAGTDRPLHVHELALVAVLQHRPQRGRGPAPLGADPASQARLVVKQQAHGAGAPDRRGHHGCHRFREFFFPAAWATGSLLGCLVSGATLRHPWRAKSRYTTEARTGRPRCWARAARTGAATTTPASRAWASQGAKKPRSCASVRRARRRPPQRGRGAGTGPTAWRNRCWRRATVARLTPSTAAVCSNVVWASAGRSTAWAARRSAMSVVRATTACALVTSFASMRRGLAMPGS